MAYSADGFTAYSASKRGNAPSMYGYKTTDTIADVNTAGYFNSLSSVLEVGDVIHCDLHRLHRRGHPGVCCLQCFWRCGCDRWHHAVEY